MFEYFTKETKERNEKTFQYYKDKYKNKYRLTYFPREKVYQIENFNERIRVWHSSYLKIEDEYEAKRKFINMCTEDISEKIII